MISLSFFTYNLSHISFFTYNLSHISIVDHLEHFIHIFKIEPSYLQDFHKSFSNLPNFFREHARGAYAISHLWYKAKKLTLLLLGWGLGVWNKILKEWGGEASKKLGQPSLWPIPNFASFLPKIALFCLKLNLFCPKLALGLVRLG